MENMTRKNGVKTYGIQKATFNAYRGDVPKSVTWQKANQTQMNTVFDNTIKGFSSILDKATGNGFSSRNEDEKAAIMCAAWAFGTSSKTFGPVRDVLSKGGTTEELAIAISQLKNPTSNTDYDNGYYARKFMCVPMAYGNYDNFKDRKTWDEHRKNILANPNLETEVANSCKTIIGCKKIFNEQQEQIDNASSIANNTVPKVDSKQNEQQTQQAQPQAENQQKSPLNQFISDITGAFTKYFTKQNKNAINKPEGAGNDRNTDDNMQQGA